MGLLKLFDKRPEPFPENGPAEAQRRWFQETSPWDEMSPTITETVIETFSNNLMIVLFVGLSMEHDLVGRYKAIDENDWLKQIARSQIGTILFREGHPSFIKVMEEMNSPTPNISRIEEPMRKAFDCFETSVIFENDNPMAQFGLAYICQIFQRRTQFDDHIERGLSTLDRWENIPFPEELIGEVEITELKQQFDQLKANF